MSVASRNVRLFIAFRVLFNARWYYPIMAVLFLDFGLSIEQYALLNVAWAAAIVGLEVPSGALADAWGRKRLVVLAAVLMVIEMAIFTFAPTGRPTLLFVLFLLNRVLSGAAEASASGADEALVFDSLAAEGRAAEWPAVLERLMRWQSGAFFIAMLLGAALYDPHFVQRLVDFCGIPWQATKAVTMRLPVGLTLLNAIAALGVTLAMREPSEKRPTVSGQATWGATLAAGRWILATPIALAIILGGLCTDNVTRLFLTLGSNYYRLIRLPDASFGLIGSSFAVLGFFTPALARRLVLRQSMQANFLVVAGLIFVGLLGVTWIVPIYGLWVILPLGIAMALAQFFVSHYLNAVVTDSRQRATVLSFRGLAYNLAYGAAGLLFAALTGFLAKKGAPDVVFVESLRWLPGYFAVSVGLVVLIVRRILRGGKGSGFPQNEESGLTKVV